MQQPKWLEWGRALQILAQNGLAYSRDPFDIERFGEIRRIAANMLAEGSADETTRLDGLFRGETGYATPKVDVRGAVIHEGRILLVRENMDNRRWTLPGGWADVGDSPGDAVAREIQEESGYTARPVKLAACYDRDRHGHPPVYFAIYKLFFLCEITGGAPINPNLETGGVDFFPEDALPELSISRVTPAEIHRMFQHWRNPNMPTDFD